MAAGRSTNKHDVALAEVRRKAKRDAILAQGLVIVAVVTAATLPLLALRGIVEPLAGRTTKVDVSFVLSLAFALSVMLNALQFLKGLGRKSTIERQRRRLSDLEEVVAA